jgi:hypothetical protein
MPAGGCRRTGGFNGRIQRQQISLGRNLVYGLRHLANLSRRLTELIDLLCDALGLYCGVMCDSAGAFRIPCNLTNSCCHLVSGAGNIGQIRRRLFHADRHRCHIGTHFLGGGCYRVGFVRSIPGLCGHLGRAGLHL